MKRKYSSALSLIIMILILSLTAGCGRKGQNDVSGPAQGILEDAPLSPAAEKPDDDKAADKQSDEEKLSVTKPIEDIHDKQAAEDEPDEQPAEEQPAERSDCIEEVKVSDIYTFLESIKPDTKIILTSGIYNLSYQLEALWYEDPDIFNDTHPYVRISQVFDGTELTIHDCDNLTICGEDEADMSTELVIDPRYAAVLNFENCSSLYLKNLRLGHTQLGDCTGDVIDLAGCRNVVMEMLDIYGCGVYGIGASDETEDISVSDCVIRDCSSGSFEIYDCLGKVDFIRCTFTGSVWGGYCLRTGDNREPELSFRDCVFGEQETNTWYFDEYCINENPVWSEITSYPEYPDIEDDGLAPEEKEE